VVGQCRFEIRGVGVERDGIGDVFYIST
jgi:hypothetical protein